MDKRVVVIGGGLAGLSAAVALARQGITVELLEKRSYLGGRCRSFKNQGPSASLDNGQHILLGCYHALRHLLSSIGCDQHLDVQKQLRLDYQSPNSKGSVKAAPLPAPFHLALAFRKANHLSWTDRLMSGKVLWAAWRCKPDSIRHLTTREWLTSLGQSQRLQEYFWDTLTWAAINQDPRYAPAHLLVNVLKKAFLGKASDSSLIISKVPLSELYTHAAKDVITSRGGQIQDNCQVERILFDDQNAVAVQTNKHAEIEADAVVCAVPHDKVAQLFPNDVLKRWPALQRVAEVPGAPIVSTYLWLDRKVLSKPLIGMLETRYQWIFDVSDVHPPNGGAKQALCMVASGTADLQEKSIQQLHDLAIQEMEMILPASKQAKVVDIKAIKEGKATFDHTPENEILRLPCETPFNNVFIAGDWTDTGLPCTLEGAARSGYSAAAYIINQLKPHPSQWLPVTIDEAWKRL